MTRLAAEFDNVEIVAGCDIRTHNWFEKQWQAPAAMADLFPNATFYEDYDEMLEKADLDIVLVETGADIHAEFCAKALAKNINVLTDIPVVANLKEAEMLWKAAEKSEAILVGDRKYDAEGASLCGIDSLGVLYGHGTRAELEGERFVALAESADEVYRLLKD